MQCLKQIVLNRGLITMQTILIAGGSGLIGTDLKNYLIRNGYQVSILSRRPTNEAKNIYHWDIPTGYIDPNAFTDVNHVINLAGSSIIGGRWTPKRKQILTDSRVQSTQLLVDTILEHDHPIQHFIQASAMGYYGDQQDTHVTEETPQGIDFMAKLCGAWENTTNPLKSHTHVTILRIGLYLSKNGGVYSILSRLARFKILSGFGNGKMWTAYTHHSEFAQLIQQIMAGKLKPDIYNAVGSEPFQMKKLIQTINRKYKSPNWLPNVPAWILRFILGEASATLLNSYRVQAPKLTPKQFHQFTSIEDAIQSL